jgi:hypothetical protein
VRTPRRDSTKQPEAVRHYKQLTAVHSRGAPFKTPPRALATSCRAQRGDGLAFAVDVYRLKLVLVCQTYVWLRLECLVFTLAARR